MIQNADDAGATEVSFLFDERNYGVKSLENPKLDRFQGPALYCHNNAIFKEQDWEGIRNLMKSNKKEDPLKIGRFGIGFNSVYHITGIYIFLKVFALNGYYTKGGSAWPHLLEGVEVFLRECIIRGSGAFDI